MIISISIYQVQGFVCSVCVWVCARMFVSLSVCLGGHGCHNHCTNRHQTWSADTTCYKLTIASHFRSEAILRPKSRSNPYIYKRTGPYIRLCMCLSAADFCHLFSRLTGPLRGRLCGRFWSFLRPFFVRTRPIFGFFCPFRGVLVRGRPILVIFAALTADGPFAREARAEREAHGEQGSSQHWIAVSQYVY